MHSCSHTARSDISSTIVGVEITMHCYFFLNVHRFPSDMVFSNIVVWSTREISVNGGCHDLVVDNGAVLVVSGEQFLHMYY